MFAITYRTKGRKGWPFCEKKSFRLTGLRLVTDDTNHTNSLFITLPFPQPNEHKMTAHP